jgi:Protein of unknown function (DUF4007)
MITNTENKRFSFSGHESFQCRSLWLKKGYDFVLKGKSFNDEDAVVELGIGKNMVSSIKYWMKSFDLLDNEDNLTSLAHRLLADDGWDPYLEDEASLWLLHYHLVTKGYATIYGLTFNELRREKIEFTKNNLIAFVNRKVERLKGSINDKTVGDDFGVMIKMYSRPDSALKDKEDTFSGLLTELGIIKSYHRDKEDYFVIENTERPNLDESVILYSILNDNRIENSVSFTTLEQEPNSVVSVFGINRQDLLNKIDTITALHEGIIYSDQAGVRELQFKNKPKPFEVLDQYYAA